MSTVTSDHDPTTREGADRRVREDRPAPSNPSYRLGRYLPPRAADVGAADFQRWLDLCA